MKFCPICNEEMKVELTLAPNSTQVASEQWHCPNQRKHPNDPHAVSPVTKP